MTIVRLDLKHVHAIICCLQETHLKHKETERLKVKNKEDLPNIH